MMASRKLNADYKKKSEEFFSPSTLEIVLDDQSDSDSNDEDSNSQPRHSKSVTTDDEHLSYGQGKPIKLRNSKSHRVIEKRRRDRMNRSLGDLLNLIPHRKPENQRRIEKTEIIEMAVKYIRNSISSTDKTSKKLHFDQKSNSTIDTYRCGYQNGISDIYEFIEKYSDDGRLLTNLKQHIKQQEIELKKLTVIPGKKCNPKTKASSSKKMPHASCDISDMADERISDDHENILQFSIDEQQNPAQNTKVPVFVLHPSGTHYIPMCIDVSVVSHAFNNNNSNLSRSSSTNEQLLSHPVSIPVNFNSISPASDQYELHIQNINVVGGRHQTSVRPN